MNIMATQLERQIEQLEALVEKRLDLCTPTRGEIRCTLSAPHEREPHAFLNECSGDAKRSLGKTQRDPSQTCQRDRQL